MIRINWINIQNGYLKTSDCLKGIRFFFLFFPLATLSPVVILAPVTPSYDIASSSATHRTKLTVSKNAKLKSQFCFLPLFMSYAFTIYFLLWKISKIYKSRMNTWPILSSLLLQTLSYIEENTRENTLSQGLFNRCILYSWEGCFFPNCLCDKQESSLGYSIFRTMNPPRAVGLNFDTLSSYNYLQ